MRTASVWQQGQAFCGWKTSLCPTQSLFDMDDCHVLGGQGQPGSDADAAYGTGTL